jgi:hypothetical protein
MRLLVIHMQQDANNSKNYRLSAQLHAPAALSPGTHWVSGCVAHRAGLDAMGKRKKSLVPSGN